MHGPNLLVRSLTVPAVVDKAGNRWQYHSRSDRHSKIACWGILFDLLRESPVMRAQAAAGRIVFGLNHEMRDFKTLRKKNLDLVIARPAGTITDRTFGNLVSPYAIKLSARETHDLAELPAIEEGPVGAVLMALEAKACMTEHVKALPRFYDELNSSHLTIHGATAEAIAIGFVMVNFADRFVSSDRNREPMVGREPVVNPHDQPRVTERVLQKVRDLPRRSSHREEGFDALGICVVKCENNGTSVELVVSPPAPGTSDEFHYEQMVRRAAHIFNTRFAEG